MGIPSVCYGCYYGKGAHTREEFLNAKDLKLGMMIVGAFMETYFN